MPASRRHSDAPGVGPESRFLPSTAIRGEKTDSDTGSALGPIYSAMSEGELQGHVVKSLETRGWTVWKVPRMQLTTAGLPDLMCVHPDRPVLLALELKTERGRIRPQQVAALRALAAVPGVVAQIVRPSSWPLLLAAIDASMVDASLIRAALEHRIAK